MVRGHPLTKQISALRQPCLLNHHRVSAACGKRHRAGDSGLGSGSSPPWRLSRCARCLCRVPREPAPLPALPRAAKGCPGHGTHWRARRQGETCGQEGVGGTGAEHCHQRRAEREASATQALRPMLLCRRWCRFWTASQSLAAQAHVPVPQRGLSLDLCFSFRFPFQTMAPGLVFGFHFIFFPKSLGHAWVNIIVYQQSVLKK